MEDVLEGAVHASIDRESELHYIGAMTMYGKLKLI